MIAFSGKLGSRYWRSCGDGQIARTATAKPVDDCVSLFVPASRSVWFLMVVLLAVRIVLGSAFRDRVVNNIPVIGFFWFC